MPVFKTPFNGYSVRFSPFYKHRLAIATSQNFGILGNGRLHVLDLSPSPSPSIPPISELTSFDTAERIYDLAWSESHDSLLVVADADGYVKLYDLGLYLGLYRATNSDLLHIHVSGGSEKLVESCQTIVRS